MIDSQKMNHFKDLPGRLKALLMLKGISQRELHRRSGVSISRISEYVTGKGGPPTLSTLSRILSALEATRADLFSESELQVDPGEAEVRRLASRMASLEEQNSFFEAEISRLGQAVEELRKAPGQVDSDEESDDEGDNGSATN